MGMMLAGCTDKKQTKIEENMTTLPDRLFALQLTIDGKKNELPPPSLILE